MYQKMRTHHEWENEVQRQPQTLVCYPWWQRSRAHQTTLIVFLTPESRGLLMMNGEEGEGDAL